MPLTALTRAAYRAGHPVKPVPGTGVRACTCEDRADGVAAGAARADGTRLSTSSRRRWLLGLVAVTVPAVAAVAITLSSGSESGSTPTTGGNASGGESSRWGAVIEGLCSTRDALRADDVEEARDVFDDESHEGLHVLAARAASEDRATVARLLEAKNRVERGLDGDGSALGAPLRTLVRATGALTEELGEPAVPGSCEASPSA